MPLCRQEMKFLGQCINKTEVPVVPDRVFPILNYPAPKNCKQHRQFLGTCNFHIRFIVGYENYVAPLLPRLRQRNKWEWTAEEQEAFLKLRESFARCVQLVQATTCAMASTRTPVNWESAQL
jgi:hypothetical protein